jgi:hypothetical protein
MEARHLQRRPADVFAREFPMDLTRPLRKATLVSTTSLALVWACSGRVAAAGGQDEASRPAQEGGRSNSAHPTMHLTGCVERGVIPGSFMLTQVRIMGTDAAARATESVRPPGTSGTSNGRTTTGGGPDAHDVPADRYTLRSLERGTDLGEFVGKRVAITGRLTADRDQTGLGTRGGTADGQKGADDTHTRSDRPGGTSAGGDTAAIANIRQLDAATIRTVAGTCTPATDRR